MRSLPRRNLDLLTGFFFFFVYLFSMYIQSIFSLSLLIHFFLA
jgi:hypothetical protein